MNMPSNLTNVVDTWLTERCDRLCVSQSFRSWFVGKAIPLVALGVNSFGYHATLTYVFSGEIIHPTNIALLNKYMKFWYGISKDKIDNTYYNT